MNEKKLAAREKARSIATEFAEKGDSVGWFEEFYRQAAGNNENIPWADLEPNKYLSKWAATTKLSGDGRTALVVGCGLGDDAKFLSDLGFRVTGFDISETAIEWAKKLYPDDGIHFEAADLFRPPAEWHQAFEFVLEVYTIQPLPLEMRPQVIDQIANFLAPGGRLLVVTRGRADDEEPDELPWPVSRRDLNRFEENGLIQIGFTEMDSEEEDEPSRFVVEYERL